MATTDLALLTGPRAGELLRTALHGAGGEVLAWQASQVDHQPHRSTTVAYRVRVRWPGGAVTEERLAARTGRIPDGALLLDDGSRRVAVWRFPHDPLLPGLATAYDRRAVARLLRDLGLGTGPVRLSVRAYRPGRRAVIEAIGRRGRVFLKVVRPRRVEALHRRHRLLTDAGVPVPHSYGYTPDGLLALRALPGRNLREVIATGGRVPTARQLLSLLDRLPAELAGEPRRGSWLERVGHYAAVVAGALPEEAERATALAEEITAEAGTGPTVPVHGDFYEGQLHVAGGQVSGLLDVDTAGPGERLDDLACLLGHLSVLALVDPARAVAVNRTGAAYLATFERVVDPADLRYRTAAVVLSLATGPHRVQDPGWPGHTRARLELARRWVDSARAVRGGAGEEVLMPATDALHPVAGG